eukprot:COSAG01_NODE_44654_length_416_cov_20.230284_1_plen_77_part_00
MHEGIVRAQLGPSVKVAMLENIPIEKQYRDKVLYKVTATERWFSEADLYGHLHRAWFTSATPPPLHETSYCYYIFK